MTDRDVIILTLSVEVGTKEGSCSITIMIRV